jgi:hypothetical protein
MPVAAGDKMIVQHYLYQFNSENRGKNAARTERGEIIASGKKLNIKQLDIFNLFLRIGRHSIKAWGAVRSKNKQR